MTLKNGQEKIVTREIWKELLFIEPKFSNTKRAEAHTRLKMEFVSLLRNFSESDGMQ